MKIFIISQPKAGTYLCSNLLVELGLLQTGIHCNGTGLYQRYDFSDANAVKDFKKYTHKLESFEEVVNIIPFMGFAVGHIQYSEEMKNTLRRVKKVLVTRPFEEFEGSSSRFEKDTGRRVMTTEEKYKNIEKWKEHGAFEITFDDMINKNVEKVQELERHIYGSTVKDARLAIENALKNDSLTKSSLRKV